MILILGSSFTFSSGARAILTHKSVKQHDNTMDPKRDSFLQHAWNSDQNVCNQEKCKCYNKTNVSLADKTKNISNKKWMLFSKKNTCYLGLEKLT